MSKLVKTCTVKCSIIDFNKYVKTKLVIAARLMDIIVLDPNESIPNSTFYCITKEILLGNRIFLFTFLFQQSLQKINSGIKNG